MSKAKNEKEDMTDLAFEPYERMGFEPASTKELLVFAFVVLCVVTFAVSGYLTLYFSTCNGT